MYSKMENIAFAVVYTLGIIVILLDLFVWFPG